MTLLSELVVTANPWQTLTPDYLHQISSTTAYPISTLEALIAAGNSNLATQGTFRVIGGIVAPETPFVLPNYTPTLRVVDSVFLNEAVQHLLSFTNIGDKLNEFYKMYTDPTHTYFLDFDQYPSSYSITYYSAKEGGPVTDSVFAAAGNYVYGAVGILGGIPKEALLLAANWTQHGQPGVDFWNKIDDPHDQINVSVGIGSAMQGLAFGIYPETFFRLGPPSAPVGTPLPDTLEGGVGNDQMIGNSGDDRMDGAGGNDAMYGDAGHDLIFGGVGADNMVGGADNDAMSGGMHDDLLMGGDGDDVLFGDEGQDRILGEAGNDVLHGGPGNDRYAEASGGISGGEGNDGLTGGEGNDQLSGNNGADTLIGGIGSDVLIGDTAALAWNRSGSGPWTVTVGVQSDSGDDVIQGNEGEDTLYGGAGNDLLQGNAGLDVFNGGQGSDTLVGGQDADVIGAGQGNDALYGDLGNDVLQGDLGNDSLYGGSGADRFIMSDAMNNDRVYDFNRAEGDVVNCLTGGYTTYASGSDYVIAWSNGASITLVGVSASTLTAGWIT